ncbi:Protease 3 precursor [Aquisphaera giovannonii]|uniref:Protease 3 n=1 Tax=Aquisphaera giovannonii TaxID=406548 RepID=A0A5B9VWQ8_9BACT|nr:pitrilysin family protein [Aquisphaera giovannonii]QEH32377.1 Protease 3 precursor [Aquisphaera giovannonii]
MARRLGGRLKAPTPGDLPVFEEVLGNGLRALILPRSDVPIVVCDLYFPVGSFDEPPGQTGLAHFLEHMLFKGTDRFPKGQIDQLAFVAGGQANAETGEDFTHYWFLLPSDRWEIALQVEADRMALARIVAEEVEAERAVIGEERARDAESPQVRLDQAHLMLSYLNHPYRNPVLGWPEDLARISADDLRAFYDRHYRPDDAVLVLAGDLDPRKAMERVRAHFGRIPRRRGEPCPRSWDERPQAGRREFTLVESESLTRGLLGWHTVPRGHRDAPALDVLADLISAGRRSRLWETLVEEERLATWVEASHAPAHRAGQLFIHVEAAPGAKPAELEARILGVIEDLAADGPTDEELARARNRLEAGWRWEQGDLAGLAAGIGQAALRGDWREYAREHRAALGVTAGAVRKAAARYLVEETLTVGWSVPRRGRSRPAVAAASPAPDAVAARPVARRPAPRAVPSPATPEATLAGDPGPMIEVPRSVTRLVDYRPRRSRLPNGLRVVHEARPGTGVVALDLHVDAGWLREARPGVAVLTGRLLEEGTTSRSMADIAAAVEDAGGSLETSSTGVSLRVRAEDLAMAVGLMADLAREPAFPADAMDWTVQRLLAELKADRDDPAFHADGLFRGLIYGSHPMGRDPRGTAREVRALTLEDVRAHHRAHYAADRSFLVAAGDFDPRALARLVKAHFGSWSPAAAPAGPLPPVPPASRRKVRRVESDGEQVHILIGHLGVPRDVPDYHALVVLDHIFGSGPGFADRLGRIVRDEMGLVYTIGGGIADTADLLPGLFRVYAGTRPEEADRVAAAIAGQVRAMHEGAFSDDEVDRARRYLTGAHVFDLQTVEQRADRLYELERLSLPLDEPILWPDRIAAVTPAQVRQAARDRLKPTSLSRVEYGPISRRGQKSGAA